jgi:hypothetical protein
MCREGTGFLVPEREAHENEKIPSHVRKRVLIRAAFGSTEGVSEQGVQENKFTKEEDAESYKTKKFTSLLGKHVSVISLKMRRTGHLARLEIIHMSAKFWVEKSETAEFSTRCLWFLFKNSPPFFLTRRFINVFRRTLHYTLS